MKGKINFAHLAYGMRAMPNTPMSTPEVGVIMLVNPSPNWKANTLVCREIPIKSENSAIMGMVSAALAEPDGMMRLSRF